MIEDGASVICPYCVSEFWLAVDPGGAIEERFISDCETCCRPIAFHCRRLIDGSLAVDARTEDESP